MARRKNVKRIDPRYFLDETANRGEEQQLDELFGFGKKEKDPNEKKAAWFDHNKDYFLKRIERVIVGVDRHGRRLPGNCKGARCGEWSGHERTGPANPSEDSRKYAENALPFVRDALLKDTAAQDSKGWEQVIVDAVPDAVQWWTKNQHKIDRPGHVGAHGATAHKQEKARISRERTRSSAERKKKDADMRRYFAKHGRYPGQGSPGAYAMEETTNRGEESLTRDQLKHMVLEELHNLNEE